MFETIRSGASAKPTTWPWSPIVGSENSWSEPKKRGHAVLFDDVRECRLGGTPGVMEVRGAHGPLASGLGATTL